VAPIERYAELAIFVRVAEAAGFSAAARRLGLSTSYVSRVISRLEDRLGTQLFNRNTRRIVLTEHGRALLERASHHIEQLDEAEAVVAERAGELGGALRVTVPVYFGIRYLGPLVARFAADHPGLRLEVLFDDKRVDLLEERFDLAIRVGHLRDSSMLARRLGFSAQLTLASPAYLRKHGTPQHPRELAEHEILLYTHQTTGPVWRYANPDGGETAVHVSGRFASNSAEGTIAAAEAGVGITRVPDALAHDRLLSGSLVRILIPWEDDMPISAVYPSGRHASPNVRALVDFLMANMTPAPWLVTPGRADIREDRPIA
jgi:DNA-binding transcriptional LysR family regulator